MHAQSILLRVEWLRTIPYEVNVDDVMEVVILLLVDNIDGSAKVFGTYKTIIVEITINSNTPTK